MKENGTSAERARRKRANELESSSSTSRQQQFNLAPSLLLFLILSNFLISFCLNLRVYPKSFQISLSNLFWFFSFFLHSLIFSHFSFFLILHFLPSIFVSVFFNPLYKRIEKLLRTRLSVLFHPLGRPFLISLVVLACCCCRSGDKITSFKKLFGFKQKQTQNKHSER